MFISAYLLRNSLKILWFRLAWIVEFMDTQYSYIYTFIYLDLWQGLIRKMLKKEININVWQFVFGYIHAVTTWYKQDILSFFTEQMIWNPTYSLLIQEYYQGLI